MSKEVKEDKKKYLDDFVATINKASPGLIADEDSNSNIERLPIHSYKINDALGGGFPLGRIVEIYGPESSSKTTIALHVLAAAQKRGMRGAFIDMEHAFDKSYAESLGINFKDLVFSQPNNGEQALELARKMLQSKLFNVIVVDSVATLVPEAELSGEIGDSKMGLMARMMSQGLRMISPLTIPSNCLVIFINQTREKITMYGDPTTTTGGNALKFYASIRIEVKQMGNSTMETDNNKEAFSKRIKLKVVKNKTFPPFRECELKVVFGKGIDSNDELVEIAEKKGIIEKSGAWYSYKGNKLGQGKDNVLATFEDNPELVEEIVNQF